MEYPTFVCVPALPVSVQDVVEEHDDIVYGVELIVIVNPDHWLLALKTVPETQVTAVPEVETVPDAPPV
jgi:hypothetical protein